MAPIACSPLSACRDALLQGLVVTNPQAKPDQKGYVHQARANLVEGVRFADFEADLRQGDGNELEGKFRAAHSSSALAVNAFAPFRSDAAALRLPGGSDFTSLSFERKCPHGLVGRRAPNLDVVVEGPQQTGENRIFLSLPRSTVTRYRCRAGRRMGGR